MATINLEVSSASASVVSGVSAYSATLTITSETGVGTLALFVVDQSSEVVTPSFLYVAAPSDLQEVDEAPDFENDVTTFRTDVVEVICDDIDSLNEFVEDCKRRLRGLAIALTKLAQHSTTQVVTLSA